MDQGNDFLKAQVNNATIAHGEFIKALENHEDQAEDHRFRDLCARYLPQMREHQRMLESYRDELGAGPSMFKKAVGATVGAARNLADATRESDFLRLVSDIVMARQCEDTFKTFREAGRELGLTKLAQIGETGEAGHDAYVRDANRLVQQIFVQQVRSGELDEDLIDTPTRRRDIPPESRL